MITLKAVLVTVSGQLRAEFEPLTDYLLIIAFAGLETGGDISDPEVAMRHILASLACRWLDRHEETKAHHPAPQLRCVRIGTSGSSGVCGRRLGASPIWGALRCPTKFSPRSQTAARRPEGASGSWKVPVRKPVSGRVKPIGCRAACHAGGDGESRIRRHRSDGSRSVRVNPERVRFRPISLGVSLCSNGLGALRTPVCNPMLSEREISISIARSLQPLGWTVRSRRVYIAAR
jgi:hypothetical protein